MAPMAPPAGALQAGAFAARRPLGMAPGLLRWQRSGGAQPGGTATQQLTQLALQEYSPARCPRVVQLKADEHRLLQHAML